MERNDNDLVIDYRNGNREAIEVLVKRYLPSIYNFVRRFVGEEYADDVTQETFVKVWKHINRFDEKRNFKVWLFTIARHVSIDWTRKKKLTPFSAFEDDDGTFDVEDVSPLATEIFQRKETAVALDRLLGELSPDRKSIVLLHDSEMLPFAEIAEIVKKPMNTVKSQYRRAIMVLRKKVESGNAPKLQG